MHTPRVVSMLLLVAALAAANSYAPGILEAVLLLTALYLVAEHGAKVGDAFTNGSAGLARAFGYSATHSGAR